MTRRTDSTFDVSLDDHSAFDVDHIVLATGYRPNMDHVTFLDRAAILDRLGTAEGYPCLDTEFQTNLPGLYVAGLAATRDFGPFFGFTVACPIAAQIIGEKVVSSAHSRAGARRPRAQRLALETA